MANRQISKERKFHDSWAFILFIIFALGMNTMFLLNTSNIKDEAYKISDTYKLFGVFFSNLAFTISLMIISLVICNLIPKVLIVGSVIAVPIISLLGFFNYVSTDSKNYNAIGILLFVVNFFFLILVSFIVLSCLNYIATALKSASRIFFENFFGILFIQIICLLIFIIASFPVVLVNSDNQIIQNLRYSIVLLMTWLIEILLLFMSVFISSVVFLHIKKDNNNVFSNSLSNSMFALGSISYGALLMAVIVTLKAMISDARREDNRRREEVSTFKVIMTAIGTVILKILGDIVKLANNLAFPYMSVNGTDYRESVVQSFQLLVSSDYRIIASYHGISFVISVWSLLMSTSILLFNYNFLFPYLNVGVSGDQLLVYLGIVTFIFSSFFYISFSLLRSAILALIFATIVAKDDLKSYNPEFLALLEEEKRKTSVNQGANNIEKSTSAQTNRS